MSAICVRNLSKRYGDRTVLHGVNFQVEHGEIFALLGVNGAGKTTTLECVEGLQRYDGGSVVLHGRIGVQLQSATLPAYIRPMEAVRLFALWNKVPISQQMLDALGIGALGKTPYRALSTGQRRRLHLALALVADPEILFLDEPTAGLDVEARLALHTLIRNLRACGKTIVLASHDMAEVESLCDRIAILQSGAIVFDGTPDELTLQVGRQYHIRVRTALGLREIESEDVAADLSALLADCQSHHLSILDIQVGRGTLEQHFLRLTQEGL